MQAQHGHRTRRKAAVLDAGIHGRLGSDPPDSPSCGSPRARGVRIRVAFSCDQELPIVRESRAVVNSAVRGICCYLHVFCRWELSSDIRMLGWERGGRRLGRPSQRRVCPVRPPRHLPRLDPNGPPLWLAASARASPRNGFRCGRQRTSAGLRRDRPSRCTQTLAGHARTDGAV